MTPEEENKILAIRLSLAQSMAKMWETAYDALLYHGVNFRTLPAYTNTEALDEAQKMKLDVGRSKIMGWIERVISDIHAAVRRKNFRKV
jgi:hypothetical protein